MTTFKFTVLWSNDIVLWQGNRLCHEAFVLIKSGGRLVVAR